MGDRNIVDRTCFAIQGITGEDKETVIAMATVFSAALRCAALAPAWAMAYIAEQSALDSALQVTGDDMARKIIEALPLESFNA